MNIAISHVTDIGDANLLTFQKSAWTWSSLWLRGLDWAYDADK